MAPSLGLASTIDVRKAVKPSLKNRTLRSRLTFLEYFKLLNVDRYGFTLVRKRARKWRLNLSVSNGRTLTQRSAALGR